MLAMETPVLGKEWNIFTYKKSYKRKRISYKDFFIYLKQKQPPNKQRLNSIVFICREDFSRLVWVSLHDNVFRSLLKIQDCVEYSENFLQSWVFFFLLVLFRVGARIRFTTQVTVREETLNASIAILKKKKTRIASR